MSNKEYKSAMSKIEASDSWKTQTLTKMQTAALNQAAKERQIENARQYLKQQEIERQNHAPDREQADIRKKERAPEFASSSNSERAPVAIRTGERQETRAPKNTSERQAERAPKSVQAAAPAAKRAPEHASADKRTGVSAPNISNESKTVHAPSLLSASAKQRALAAVLAHSRNESALGFDEIGNNKLERIDAPNKASTQNPSNAYTSNESAYSNETNYKSGSACAGTRGKNGPQYKNSTAKIKKQRRIIALCVSTAALFFIGFGFVFNAVLGQNMGSDNADGEQYEATAQDAQAETELLAEPEAALFNNGDDVAQEGESEQPQSALGTLGQIDGVVTQLTQQSIDVLLSDGSTLNFIIDENTIMPDAELLNSEVIVMFIHGENEQIATEINVLNS